MNIFSAKLSAKFFVLIALTLTIAACKKKTETTDSTNVTTGVVSNLTNVSQGFAPSSLATPAYMLTGNGDISTQSLCTGVSFSECQARLLKAYLSFGKSLVDTTITLVSGIGGALGQLSDGAAGSGSSGDGFTYYYNKPSSTVFSILAKNDTSAQSMLYLSVNGGTYTLKLDGNQGRTPSAFKVTSTVAYTDASTWTVDLMIEGSSCDSTDVSAPSKVKIHLDKTNGLWTGKAMLYVPRWVDGTSAATCSTTASDSNSVMFYTDFVGNDIATKASLYFIPRTNATTTYTGFGLNDLCTNFASVCTANSLTGGALAAFTNPFCSTAASSNVVFNDTCSGSDTTVSGSSYGAASSWTAPATYLTETVSLPSSL